MTPLEKADVIYKHAAGVRIALEHMVTDDEAWREVVAVAYARHVLGSYEYGNTNLFEWSDGKIAAAILEELADAVVYQTWLHERAERG